ncbi:MAG: trypsin-like peptidase protein [Chitinophagaceae bacterium]|jgi:S1-C subfamily serine protease|nr:trypsin-like peptidase protein [Chitinophagaceae bacterium]
MDDILLLEAIENYLSGKMSAEERAYFENLRKTTPEIDQMVVEHGMFLQQMDTYAAHRNLKHHLHEAHIKLIETGEITENPSQTTKAKVIQLWRKYKRVATIAASVGGVIALVISVVVVAVSPAPNNRAVTELSRKVDNLQKKTDALNTEVRKSKIPESITQTNNGSSFLIDTRGFILTNAHVVQGLSNVVVVNSRGEEFKARIISVDGSKDLALLKIDDEDFQSPSSLPYNFKRTASDLAEEIYTLGYPRNTIVYNQGYMSALTGFNGDTLSYQLSVTANPGNSGGPVLNKNGEIIGVLSGRQEQAEGVVFAVRTKAIHRFIDQVKKADTSLEKIKLPTASSLKGKDRPQQIKQLQEYVYQVKAF